jgi:hypothetical protein
MTGWIARLARVVAVLALVVELAAAVAGDVLALNLAFVVGMGAVVIGWVLRPGEER